MTSEDNTKTEAQLPNIARHWAIILLYPALLFFILSGRHHVIFLLMLAVPIWTNFNRRKFFSVSEFLQIEGTPSGHKWRILITIGFCVFITYRIIVVALERSAGT